MKSKFAPVSVALCGVVLVLSSLALAGPERPVTIRPNVVYGNDDRTDLKDVRDPMIRKIADSTVALFRTRNIQMDRNTGIATLALNSYGRQMGLCPSERFFDQLNGAFCSGTLVGPDTILTAGHCITSEADCAQTAFVFGFAVNTASQTPRAVAGNQVYQCTSIVMREQVGTGADFAIVKIDRVVPDHAAMRVNRNGGLTSSQGLVMIGHPSGLPTKVAGDAHLRSLKNGYFVATTDSYGGNSGSGVFNERTGLLEGVLVRGETDFERSPEGCMVTKVCAETDCRGEDVTSPSAFARFIQQ